MRRKVIPNFTGREMIVPIIDHDLMIYVDGRLLAPDLDYQINWQGTTPYRNKVITFTAQQNNVVVQIVGFNGP